MRGRLALRTLILLAMNVGNVAPLTTYAQSSPDIEIACDVEDALQQALARAPAGGRIVIRSGTCAGNFTLVRDVRILGSGSDRVVLRATNSASAAVTVERGVTATVSGVTIAAGRVGLLVNG